MLLKLEVGDLGSIKQLHIDVSLLVLNVSQNLVESCIVIGVDSFGKVLLRLLDSGVAVVAEADWSFLLQTVFAFINPVTSRAEHAPEFAAILAVVLDVTEIELRLVALLATAVRSLDTLVDKCPRLRVCGKIDGGVTSRILEMNIGAE